ncbi:adenosine 5'-monophosphoramidase HINT3 isoform X2 [Diabrotica virgifera virgifera]|uniref:Adenosine 5'-monophosphoramidase HINT3 n=2 Tax=Diabrotica virgifera virgifera TaxID=50390 RepID=A0A6P7F890_DIAVI|nr:adenosine 5'-monophosphoramidase HINT3 isoform X2 [Diabrotica virgifera virgifera]
MTTDVKCIFCKIISGDAPAEVLFQNEELIVFLDIKPASSIHFMVVPKKHIPNINSLKTNEDKLLVERMLEVGKRVLELKNGNSKDSRIGFHCPPYTTVDHLHLHFIYPEADMSPYHQMLFQVHHLFFELADDVILRLST